MPVTSGRDLLQPRQDSCSRLARALVPFTLAAGTTESKVIAARQLLGLPDLTGVLVIGDALRGRGETARLIDQKGVTGLCTLQDNLVRRSRSELSIGRKRQRSC